MALLLLLLLIFIFVTTSPCIVAAQQTNGSVPSGASLTATPDAKPWLSSSGEFAFGFKQVQDNFLLSIWFDKIPDQTIVWYPKDGPMVPAGSKVELLGRRGLVLSDPQGREVWSSGTVSDLAYGFMNDTGNFVIVATNSSKIWESFKVPSDTLLPTQVMELGEGIHSRLGDRNFSGGRFELRLLPDGNLVLNTRDIASDYTYDAYYISYTYDISNSMNSGGRVIFDETGYLYILRRNGQRSDLTRRGALPSGEYYHRATLDSDGIFTQYYLPKNPTSNTSWEVVWYKPDNICAAISTGQGSGACGFNSVCSLDNNRKKCECPQGFSLLDPDNPKGDCKPDFTPSCGEGESNNVGDVFDFIELSNIDWAQMGYEQMNPSNVQSCKSYCLEDCFCAVAIYKDNACLKKRFPLFSGRKDASINAKAFIKFQKGGRPPWNPPPKFPRETKDQRSLILVLSAILGSSAFVIVILIGVILVGFYKKTKNPYPGYKAVKTNLLPHFTYQELVKATDGFSNELGKGAFGIVYKGVIGTNIVAVKKLDTKFQDGEKEFQTEVNAIARTHHKNLVQLLGYCDDGEQRLLIYEYMSNGTLAEFIFGEVRPSWKQRSCIAVGIPKGLSYLHEECSTQVIHCDIKPQNILLDDYYEAKIADFGLAKLLVMNQSRTNTGIRGTKGYVAPEWFRNTPVTAKVDVYSFGVLLLEIVSCRKSVVFESGSDGVDVLCDWAWDCYQEGRLDVLVEKDSEAMDDYKRLTTFVMVGLWCVQENPSLRPKMRTVIQMLEGVVQVTECPPCPFPFSGTYGATA